MTQTLQPSHNIDLEPLGLCNSGEYKTVFFHLLRLEKISYRTYMYKS